MAEDMYAVVDMTKKKKKHPIPGNIQNLPKPVATYSMVTASECQPTYAARKGKNMPKEKETALSAVCMYDVVERDVRKGQKKDLAETFDANYSTLDLHNTDNSTATKTTPDSLPQPVEATADATKKRITDPLKTECGSCNKFVCAIAVIIALTKQL